MSEDLVFQWCTGSRKPCGNMSADMVVPIGAFPLRRYPDIVQLLGQNQHDSVEWP